jgi:hypothetical protein
VLEPIIWVWPPLKKTSKQKLTLCDILFILSTERYVWFNFFQMLRILFDRTFVDLAHT